jgi:hypothetical protein
MIIKLVGLIIFASGGALSFGVYRAVQLQQIETLTAVLIPSFQLSAGMGVFMSKSPGRYFSFVLCCFYVMIGILGLRGAISPVEFIPFVPLVEYIPPQVLKIDNELISIACYFVIPVFIALVLCSKAVAQHFDYDLKGQYSWNAPILVMLASSFVICASFLTNTNLDAFRNATPQTFFGFSLDKIQVQTLMALQFVFPIILGFGFSLAQKWAWLLLLVMGFTDFGPFVLAGFPKDLLDDFGFMFFRSGWLFVVLSAFVHWRFFLSHDSWIDRREARFYASSNPRAAYVATLSGISPEDPTIPQEPVAAPVPAAPERRRIRLLPIIIVVFLIGGAAFWFFRTQSSLVDMLNSRERNTSIKEEPLTPSEVGRQGGNAKAGDSSIQETPASIDAIRLQGTSVDPQGSYAIINDEVIEEGRSVKGHQVLKIESNRVLISKDGNERWLTRS